MSILFTPSPGVQTMFVALDRNTQLKIQHGLDPACYWNNIPHFRTSCDDYLFEARVEVAHLQKEMKEKWENKYDKVLQHRIISYIHRTMASYISIPLCKCVFFNCEHITLEGVRAIHKIVCDNEPNIEISSKETRDSLNCSKMGEEEYKERVIVFLHKVAVLALKNKSLTEELLGLSLKTCAASLVKTQVENKVLEILENFMEFTNIFSCIFDKYEKITPIHKEIISGLLNLNEKEPWIVAVANACTKFDIKDKHGLQQKVLEEFLKKI